MSKRIDLPESNISEECRICHGCLFNHGFKFQDYLCNGCHDLTMLCLNISDITIIAVKNVDYRCIIYKITKFEAIKLLENTLLEDIGFYKKILLVLIFTFFV